MRLFLLLTVCAASWAALETPGHADSRGWTSFRNGGDSHASGTSYPTTWSPRSNIAWQRETRGYGQSVPVVSSGRVFTTAVEGPNKEIGLLTCFDLASGEVEWTYEFETSEHSPSNYMNSRAAPSPLIDADHVYGFFESGDLVALNHNGEIAWERSLTAEFGPVQNHHGLGASPTQTDDLVVLNVEHDGPSYLIAITKADGKTAWKVDRPSGKSWTSPIVVPCGQRDVVVVSSSGHVDAYDVSNGEHLWSRDGLAGNTIPSPTPMGRHVLIGARIPEFGNESDASASNMLLKLTDDGTDGGVAWRADRAVCYYASPIAVGEYAYFMSKQGVLACLNAVTGESVYRKRLGMECWSTPIVVENAIYFFGRNGESKAIRTGPTFEVLHENHLWPEENPPVPLHYVEASGGPSAHGGGTHGAGTHGSGDHSHQTTHSAAVASPPAVASPENDPESTVQPLRDTASTQTVHENPSAPTASNDQPKPGGFAARLLKGDSNGDGSLSVDEVPDMLKSVFPRLDKDDSGTLDAEELALMENEFRKKRENSRADSRDPIVYGVAAAEGTFIVRTGTRLYAIRAAQ